MVSALYKTSKEALASWIASYGNVNITFKYPALFLFSSQNRVKSFSVSPMSKLLGQCCKRVVHLTTYTYTYANLVRSYSHLDASMLTYQ